MDLAGTDFVLVDNDDLIRETWRLRAEARGLAVKAFSSIGDLLAFSDAIPKDIPNFLDSHLGENARRQDAAPQLRKPGFTQVYVTTNYVDLHGAKLPHMAARLKTLICSTLSLISGWGEYP
ncbi:MAG: hypothetical protein IPL83_01835 [Bdellovibrionales bacterium]|nr:hypothetical protein [Bdellovibrionales bacterium]